MRKQTAGSVARGAPAPGLPREQAAAAPSPLRTFGKRIPGCESLGFSKATPETPAFTTMSQF